MKDGSISVGICDGHWTDECANAVSYALPHFIENMISEDREAALRKSFEDLDEAIIELPWKIMPELSKSVDTIRKVDVEKRKVVVLQSEAAFSGACAITANIRADDLYVAHAGDW